MGHSRKEATLIEVGEHIVWWGYEYPPQAPSSPAEIEAYVKHANECRRILGWTWGRIHWAANQPNKSAPENITDPRRRAVKGMECLHEIATTAYLSGIDTGEQRAPQRRYVALQNPKDEGTGDTVPRAEVKAFVVDLVADLLAEKDAKIAELEADLEEATAPPSWRDDAREAALSRREAFLARPVDE